MLLFWHVNLRKFPYWAGGHNKDCRDATERRKQPELHWRLRYCVTLMWKLINRVRFVFNIIRGTKVRTSRLYIVRMKLTIYRVDEGIAKGYEWRNREGTHKNGANQTVIIFKSAKFMRRLWNIFIFVFFSLKCSFSFYFYSKLLPMCFVYFSC